MSFFKDMLYGSNPVASEAEADQAAGSVCNRLQYDRTLTEPVRRTYAAFVKKYAHEVAQLRFSKFEEEVEHVISSNYYVPTDLGAMKAEVLECLNSDLVNQARREASRRHYGLA